MRFEWDGRWAVPEDGPLQGSLAILYGDSGVSPPTKVFKRLTNGPEDNIEYYFQVFQPKSSGDAQ
jgi:hypothetical protein